MEAVSLETISETCVSNSNECQLNLERSDRQMSKPRKRKRKPRKKEKELKSNDSQINNAASFEERKEGETEKTTSEDQVQLPKNCLSTREDSQPGGINTTCSERKRQRKKRKKDKNRNVLREGGVDTNSEVTTKCDARHVSEAEGSQFKSTDEKNVASDVINGCLKSKDDSVEQQMGADLKANDTVSQTQNPKAKKKKRRKSKTMEVCDALGTTLATSTKSKSVESMKIAGVSEVRSKKRKRKKKKTSSTDQKSADMEVCDPSGNTLPATIESGSVECSLDHSNKQILGNCDRSAGPEFLGEDRTSKTEKSATGELCGVHNPGTRQEKAKDEIGGSKQKRKRNKSKKKKKSCEDHKTDNMDLEVRADDSWIWKFLLSLRPLAKRFLECEIGDGKTASFWSDKWCPIGPLIDVVGTNATCLMGVPSQSTVDEAYNLVNWRAPSRTRNTTIRMVRDHLSHVQPPNTSRGKDSFFWVTSTGRGTDFSTKKTWETIRPTEETKQWAKAVWFRNAVPKHAFTFWVANLNRLPVKARMASWGININPICTLCSLNDETRNHLFLECEFAIEVWLSVMRRFGYSHSPFLTWQDMITWVLLRSTPNSGSALLRKLATHATIYHIWRERNSRIHNNIALPPITIFGQIDRVIRDSLLAIRFRKGCSGLLSEWFTYS